MQDNFFDYSKLRMTGSNEKKEIKTLARGKPLGITEQDWIDRTTFHYGDIVMAKIGKSSNSKPWIARIEFVNAELCPSRQQKHYPWEGTDTQKYDHDFKYVFYRLKQYKVFFSDGRFSSMGRMK